jgi:hypothetical protein
VSETRTCPGREGGGGEADMSGHRLWNPAAKRDIAERPDTAERSDMSGESLWNPVAKPDKAERPDISGLGGGHVWPESLKSG